MNNHRHSSVSRRRFIISAGLGAAATAVATRILFAENTQRHCPHDDRCGGKGNNHDVSCSP
jgi:hypothetical protein